MEAGEGRADARAWLDEHGDVLYRYALLRVGDATAAEDLVQETLLAALEGHERFRGRSSVRTWLVGILKHKAIDHIRRAVKEPEAPGPTGTPEDVAPFFQDSGLWGLWPQKWGGNPAGAFERQEFWDVYVMCLAALPEQIAMVFSLREMDEVDSDELCKILGVTATNLWTMLHRARMRLRRCLEENWFAKPS